MAEISWVRDMLATPWSAWAHGKGDQKALRKGPLGTESPAEQKGNDATAGWQRFGLRWPNAASLRFLPGTMASALSPSGATTMSRPTVEATAVHKFACSPELVFDAWLDPVKVRSWATQPVPGMPTFDIRRVEIDARVGGKFMFSDMRDDGEAMQWGYYLEMERPSRLTFSCFTSEEEEQENNSVVTLTIEPLADGCRATLVHRMDERWVDYVGQTELAWSFMLRQIDAWRMKAAESHAQLSGPDEHVGR